MDENTSNEEDKKFEVTCVEFERLCQDLGISESVKVKAWNTWCDFTSRNDGNQKVFDKKNCYTAVIYIAIVDTSMPYGPSDPHLDKQSPPCLTLSELLKKSNLNFVPFTNIMRTLREEITLSEAVLTHLCNVEKRYCIVSPLFDKYNRVCATVFRNEDDSTRCKQPFSRMDSTDYRKRLCWTLFVLAKESIFGDSQELIRAYNLLLCCVEFIIRSTPSFQLQEPFDMLRLKVTEKVEHDCCNTFILEKLAESFQTTVEDLNDMHLMCEDFFISLMNANDDMEIKTVETLYHDRYRRVGDLDELLFLQVDPHLVLDSSVSGNVSQSNRETPVTPVRAAMNTVRQLKSILSSSEDKPCDELEKYFQNCSSNPENSISERLRSLESEFTEKYCVIAGDTEKSTAGQRFNMGIRLYYRVMHTLLNMERERLSLSDFSNLLNNETFHKSLLACSMEIVLVTYSMSWNPTRNTMGSEDSQFVFPWILEVFDLFAYDFYKVLESFIKAEPNLTRDIIKHLTVIENRILEHIAWKEGSPLHDAIAKCDSISTNISSPSKDLTNGHGPSRPSTSTAELYLSPFKGQQIKSPSQGPILTSPRKKRNSTTNYSRQDQDPQSQETPTGPRRSHSLNLFFNKVGRLGYTRLSALSEMLNVPKDVLPKIWTCFEYSITSRPDLLKNRHLDQIMMCSLYAICKVFNNETKFKDIVKIYCTLPYTEPKTYKQVLLEGDEHDTVVMFYNRIYMPQMKNYILQFAKTVQPNLSPVPRSVNSPLPVSPRYSLPGKKNFHVSPMRESPFKAPHSPGSMTPRSRKLYSFGEGIGSAEKLKNINETLSAFKSRNGPYVTTPKSLKRLSFDNPEDNSQNSPGSSQEKEPPTIVIKKKRVTPPDAITK